ncbi:MAG TPA: hypothetical protein VMW64_00890 [Dehalococcoidia bacterium]|nr:hypothetical protein [Dehalococcoidia bacterium]
MKAIIESLETAEGLLRSQIAMLLFGHFDAYEAGKIQRAMSDVNHAIANLQGASA